MKKQQIIWWALAFYLLLSGGQCTETVVTTQVTSEQKVASGKGGFTGDTDKGDRFGSSIARIGDLEVDGVIDLAVGAPFADDNGEDKGAVWILFMNSDGRVDMQQKISENAGAFAGDLDDKDHFGSSVAGIGDLNADGFLDLAVGAPNDDDGGSNRGAVWILFLNADGTVQASQKISSSQGGFTADLKNDDQFGNAVDAVGDLDGDGITDLAVGAQGDSRDGDRKGAVWILFMNADGTVKSSSRIASNDGGFDGNLNKDDQFGSAVAGIGDLDGDGIDDLAVGANQHDEGGSDRGAVWVLFMNADGSVRSEQQIGENKGKFEGNLSDGDLFGSAISSIGDLNDDGVDDLVVGASGDDDGGENRGAVWILFMKDNGEVKREKRISSTDGKLKAELDNNDRFGSAVAGLVDLNGDGDEDFASGAPFDDGNVDDKGAIWIVFMERKKEEENKGFLFSGN